MASSLRANADGTMSVLNGSGIETVKFPNTAGANTSVATIGDVIGVGQTWQDVTASRSAGVTYTNTTGKPIVLMASVVVTASGIILNIFVNGVVAGRSDSAYSAGGLLHAMAIIPNGMSYIYNITSGSITSSLITELR